MQRTIDQTGFFVGGVDSRNDPAYLGQTSYAWGVNGINRGGVFGSRPGHSELCLPPFQGVLSDDWTPQGFTVFTPLNDDPFMVVAQSGRIFISRFPFGQWVDLGLSFRPYLPIIFEIGIKAASTNVDGSLSFEPQPYPVLLIQDGITRAAYWDGVTAKHDRKIPIATTMKWNSQRMWFGRGSRLRAGDLADPLGMTEENITSEGGFFTMPNAITGIGETPDQLSLLVFTDQSTISMQSSIYDRTQWAVTPNFQKVLFLNIGCVSHRSIINQYGLTWWMSHNGIISLDNALQTYRTSRVHYRDNGMMRSKVNMGPDLSGVCAGNFENFIFFAVPSGDRHNNHIFVMDQTVVEVSEQGEVEKASWAGIWTGIRPVQFWTGVINGHNRCLALSRDYAPSSNERTNYQIGIWEMFNQQRKDAHLDGTVKRITSGFETKMMSFSAEPKKITAVEIDLSGLVGVVNIRLFFIGRRTGTYIPIGTKQIVSTEGLSGVLGGLLGSYASQRRVIRSSEIQLADRDFVSVQGDEIPSIDRGFSVYVEWDGEMRLHGIRIFTKPEAELKVGAVEVDETTDRIVSFDGTEKLLNSAPLPSVAHPRESSFVDSFQSRYLEPAYSSR